MQRTTIAVESAGEAYLALLKARGIDYLFANAGTDFAPIIEAFAQAQTSGTPLPRPVAVAHENLAVGMAHGYYMVSGRPQAVMVHVNVGTANALCGLLNAERDRVPIIMTAGRTPVLEGGRHGARTIHVHWAQEMFDQAAMVREAVKWDYELRDPAQIEAVVDRALSIAMTEPRGPVYLSLPREVLAAKLTEFRFGAESRLAPAAAAHPDPEAIEQAAAILGKAERPVIITARLGRDPEAVALLGELADRFAIPVVENVANYMCLATDHPMHGGFDVTPWTRDADAILVLDCDVPWFPDRNPPPDSCRVVQIGPDPMCLDQPMHTFTSDVTIAADPGSTLPVLIEALARATKSHRGLIEERSKRIAARHAEIRAKALAAAAQGGAPGRPMTAPYVSRCIDAIRTPETIIINEYPLVRGVMSFDRPGTFFGSSPAGGLGWGLAAALGAKLAAPERLVIATLGDGAYMFNNPVACHHLSEAEKLPVLVVIFNNNAWGAVRHETVALYPHGAAAKSNRMPLATIDSAPRFEKVIEASGGYGERVEEAAALPAALARAVRAVTIEKRQALLNVICA